MRLLFLMMLTLFISAAAQATVQEQYPFTTLTDTQRFQHLTQEIRCVVCQNQNIADSNAPLANDLRVKIYQMVIANKSDSEIKNYLVKRYGEFILLQPRFSKLTMLLWLFPFFGFVMFASLFVWIKRRDASQ